MSIAEVVAIGLILVFTLLILITGVLYLFPAILRVFAGSKGTAEKVAEPSAKAQTEPKGSNEIIAVIMAAVAAAQEEEGVPYGNFRVVSFRRLGRKGA